MRYYQAWSEPIPPDEAGGEEEEDDDEEGGEWGDFGDTPSTTTAGTNATTPSHTGGYARGGVSASIPPRFGYLPPVREVSSSTGLTGGDTSDPSGGIVFEQSGWQASSASTATTTTTTATATTATTTTADTYGHGTATATTAPTVGQM